MPENIDEDDPSLKKTPRAVIVRRAIVGLLALACAGGWVYSRWLVKKETLGGPCSFAMNCRTEAPTCLKQTEEGDGVCSRPCTTDADCADNIRCVKVELDERDDRGRPLEGGYCFPQSLIDARKKKKDAGAATAKSDSWVDVPQVQGQLEGEVVFRTERGSAKTESAPVTVKGTLVRAITGKHGRTVIDTSSLRSYVVDDDKASFSASVLSPSPGEAQVSKTDRKDQVEGRDCEIWMIESGSPRSTREVCVVMGGAFIDPSSRSVRPWERELAVRGVFPLRVIERDGSGRELSRLTVSRFDAHATEAALFAIPKSYKNLAAH